MIQIIRKLSFILSRRDKQKLLGVLFIIVVNSFFDLVGVAIILPVITLLTEGEEAINQNLMIKIISDIFKTTEINKLAIIILSIIVLFFLIKVSFCVFYHYVVNRFTLNYSRKISKKMIESYLAFPYEYHLNNNSSLLIRKCTYDSDNITQAINAILKFISTIITSLLIFVYLMINDYRITLIVTGVLFIVSVIVLYVLKPHIKKIAHKIQVYNSDNYKYLSQAFNSVKESKISNSESFFTSIYNDNKAKIHKLSIRKNVFDVIPAQSIELFGMIGVCLSLSIIVLFGNDTNVQIIQTFAIFVYAIIKLLPAISTITTTLNQLNFYRNSVDAIYNDLNEIKKANLIVDNEKVTPMPFEKSIVGKDIVFYYSSSPDKIILNKVSFSINKNTSVAFSGASGAGKTTVIDVILGLLPCRSGTISCDGIDIESNLKGWRSNISYVPQNIYLSDDTIRNNVAFGIEKNKISDEMVWDSLEKAQLSDYVKNLPHGLDTVIGERGIRMSGGQRQRLGIARAFYRNTNIVVLDEATSALDYETEKNILEHVSQYAKNHTLIIITHRLNTIENCDKIYKVENGSIFEIK